MNLSASLGTPAHRVARIEHPVERKPVHQAATPPPEFGPLPEPERKPEPRAPYRSRDPERDARIIEMRRAGMTQEAIGDEVGLTGARISQILMALEGKEPAELRAQAAAPPTAPPLRPAPRMRGVQVQTAVRFGAWVSGLKHNPSVPETMDEFECSRGRAQALVDAWWRLVNGWLAKAGQIDFPSTEASVAFGEWAARLDQPPHTREIMDELRVSRKMAQRYVLVWEKISGQPRRFAPRGRPARRKDVAERDARILAMHRSGRTLLQIAGEFGLTKARIGQILQRARDREPERTQGHANPD